MTQLIHLTHLTRSQYIDACMRLRHKLDDAVDGQNLYVVRRVLRHMTVECQDLIDHRDLIYTPDPEHEGCEHCNPKDPDTN